jgi:hypothetical protein
MPFPKTGRKGISMNKFANQVLFRMGAVPYQLLLYYTARKSGRTRDDSLLIATERGSGHVISAGIMLAIVAALSFYSARMAGVALLISLVSDYIENATAYSIASELAKLAKEAQERAQKDQIGKMGS